MLPNNILLLLILFSLHNIKAQNTNGATLITNITIISANEESVVTTMGHALIEDDKELIQSLKGLNNDMMAQFKYANEILESDDRNSMDTLGLIVRELTQYSDFYW